VATTSGGGAVGAAEAGVSSGVWADKRVYVTGASSGLGREMALQLARQGARLALFARRGNLLAQLSAAIVDEGGTAPFVAAVDVASRPGVARAMRDAAAAIGAADVLIANAGMGYPVRVDAFDAERAWRIYEVNVRGALNAIEAVLPAMLARGSGRIAGVSSMAAFRSYAQSHAYCASKSALSAQLEGLRLELAGRGISVTTLCPGFVRTDMTASNTVPMPFILECDDAARRMLRAIERRKRVYAFPWPMYWLVRASRLVPEALIGLVTTPKKGRSYKEPSGSGG
jgi:short-subunit dehydrogenase